ncbi:RING-H2 finger protein ATL70-like [Typha angustifolia]|uniref:RING-H2 finger protein ATL70-like n=1 Tax=Typha angustifolia TaxID=59011 RepID=UPI003C2EDF49
MSSNTSVIAPDGGSIFSTERIGSFGYGVTVSVGILLLITTITLASYFCTRTNTQAQPATRRIGGRQTIAELAVADNDVEIGIDEATLMSYPKVLYSQAKLREKGRTTSACCSICLTDYKNSDVLRELPECGHLFHLKCVDPWLRLHPSCPVCRTSPLASPLPTPLAEVVPLARQS